MGTRFGLRVGFATAALACALLVACGGGGGGSTSTPPTVAPTATPTLAPATQSTVAPVTPAGGTVSLGGISAGGTNVVSSASVAVPAYTGASSVNTTISMQATLPTGATTPAYAKIKKHESIPYTNINPLAYIVLQVSANITITQSPGFTVTAPSALSGNFFVAVLDLNNASQGWSVVSGPVTPVGATLTFPSGTIQSFPLSSTDTYIFVIFSATATPTPAPTATPTPTPSPTATPTPVPTATPAIGSAATLPPVEDPNSARGGYSPYDVASSLNFLVQSGFNGQGETVAIIGDMPPATNDLTNYLLTFQIPGNPLSNYSVVNLPNSSPSNDPGGQGEAVLDVETVMGLAPGATIKFYNTQGDLSNQAFLAAEQKVAADNPDVFSISFGGCEQYPAVPAPGPTPPDAPVFAAMNANHTAVTVSSGDEGDNCSTGVTPADVFGVDYPGSDPNVISVGGNETAPGSGTLVNPASWNDNFFSSGQGATGGGVSTTFPIPGFQSVITGASASYRNTPDIAFPAEGVIIYLSNKTQEFGGTSWSAPEAAAMFAELDEYCGGRPPSNPIAWMYTAYSRNHANFIDITTGDNHWASESVTYAAHAGYDNNTGLGVPKSSAVATTVCASRAWAGAPAGGYTAQSLRYESYGEARDTMLPFAERFNRAMDLGERASSDRSSVTLVLRHTATAANDEQSVIASLKAAGFTVQQTFANHSIVQVVGPASAVNRYFNTSIHNVSQGNYGTRYANATALTLPASIAPYVSNVLADTLVARTPKHHRIR